MPMGAPCPQCGQDNPVTRRFCGRCGFTLVPASATAPPLADPARAPGRWSSAARGARRDYRRSLPGHYWLNRVLLVLVPLVALVVTLSLTGNDPIGWVVDKYRELTGGTEPVDNVVALERPKDSVAPGFDVTKLPGPREEAWATAWPQDAVVSDDCGISPAGGEILLRWDEPTRVRGLAIWAGLDDASTGQRELQFRPKRLGVIFGDRCIPLELEDSPDRQELVLDTETEVRRLRITVDDAYPSSATPPQYLVAIGGIDVLHQPE